MLNLGIDAYWGEVCAIFLIENGKGCNGRLIERITPVDSIGVCESCPFDVRLVNGSLHDESKPGIMMQDLCRRDLRNLRDPKFKERMDELLHQKIGRKAMCEAQEKWENELLERGRDEGREEGLEKGREEGREEGSMQRLIEMTKRIMTHLGKTLDDAMALLQLTEDEKVSVRLCMATS